MKLILFALIAALFGSSQCIFPFLIPIIAGGAAAASRVVPAAVRIGTAAARGGAKAGKGVGKGARGYDRFERLRERIRNRKRK